MIVVIVAAATVSIAGAILALAARDARLALRGLAVLLVASAFVADPLPEPLPVLARVIGALLAVELLLIALRLASGEELDRVRPVDPRVLGLAAAAGAIAGVVHDVDRLTAGAALSDLSPVVLGTAFALVAVGASPLIVARDILQLGLGATVVMVGAAVGRTAAAPGTSGLASLVTTGLLVAVAAAVAGVLIGAAERRRVTTPVLVERPPLPLPRRSGGSGQPETDGGALVPRAASTGGRGAAVSSDLGADGSIGGIRGFRPSTSRRRVPTDGPTLGLLDLARPESPTPVEDVAGTAGDATGMDAAAAAPPNADLGLTADGDAGAGRAKPEQAPPARRPGSRGPVARPRPRLRKRDE